MEDDLITRPALAVSLLLLPLVSLGEFHVVIIEGLAGDPVYAEQFEQQISAITTASRSVTEPDNVHVFRTNDVSRDAVLGHLESMQSGMGADDRFALYLIGHGSYDDYEYKFNIPGPDLTGEDIATALDALPATNQLFVNTSSSSGATDHQVVNDDRIVVLATRSGAERHATRFGTYFAGALSNASADIDKNGSISVNEAFDFAERHVNDYFEQNNQLTTEHAQLSGDRADRLTLARLDDSRPIVVDTALASLIADREAVNQEIDSLRLARDDMPIADYQSALLEKILKLARIEDAIDARQEQLGADE